MKTIAHLLLILAASSLAAQMANHSSLHPDPSALKERLGTVSFPVSCAASSQAYFDHDVALLHDFWYAEAARQFGQLAQSDPHCAMAHWGVAMSAFHQIWERPDDNAMKLGWSEMQLAQSLPVATERERAYIAALADYYRPGTEPYASRVGAYSAAMGLLYARYPDDVDAGAFYALSLLAAKAPDDTGLAPEHKAMAVLTPLFAKYPDNPGVVHYIIHSCDNPTMAAEGLAAANHYGEIAQSGPHAFHMPGHIYARLGMWPQDIAAQVGSINASQQAAAHGESGIMDEPHSYDFLIYAYLQSGQDVRAKAALDASMTALDTIAYMPGMGSGYMTGMISYYRPKLAGFYALGMHQWKTAAAIEPVAGSPPDAALTAYWVRALGDGHLRRPEQAQADLAHFDELVAEVRKGKNAYEADQTSTKIERSEIVAWAAFANGKQDEALSNMRAAADLQDKVGQQEVDIPAREMLADMLLQFGHPQQALAEYEVALKLSPNRLDGLYGAGRAAEAAGDKPKAKFYYTALLKSTGDGANSVRPELAHAKSFVSSTQMAAN